MLQDPFRPAIPKQLPRELLPQELQSILTRIEQRYGANLKIIASDPGWLQIRVEGLDAPDLYEELQSRKNVLFAGVEDRVQLIHPLSPEDSGLFLHLLSPPSWSDRAQLGAFAR